MDHQREGAKHLLRGHAFLAFEPGLGKTRTCIEALDQLGITGNVLVICPAIARENWKQEFAKWETLPRNVVVGVPLDARGSGSGSVLIVSYDAISSMSVPARAALLTRDWNVLILDEAHRLKNPDAKRTLMIYGQYCSMKKAIAAKASRVWLLSGTPAPNNVAEMWTHLRALKPEAIRGLFGEPMAVDAFEDAFCKVRKTVYGRQIVGSRNIPELRRRMGDFFLPKREKDCVDLPDLIFDTVELPVDDLKDKATLKRLDEALTPYALAKDPVAALNGAGAHIAEERRLLGTLKAPLVGQFVQNELAGAPEDYKVLLFFWHKDVGRTLADVLVDHRPAFISGATGVGARAAALAAFKDDPKCRVFIGQMQATGEAINLTTARRVIFAEPSWTPKDNYQAAKRAHRIGQTNHVHASYLAFAGSMDARILKAIEKKTRDLYEFMA
jgi:SWI/SNF-related matrix-associated actin-dependent regulator 1 of chromatin subfamily A